MPSSVAPEGREFLVGRVEFLKMARVPSGAVDREQGADQSSGQNEGQAYFLK